MKRHVGSAVKRLKKRTKDSRGEEEGWDFGRTQ